MNKLFTQARRHKTLITILLIASVLRIYGLDKVPVSLFGDELDVGYHAYSILNTGRDYSGNLWPLHFESLAEWRTPLYLYSVVPTVAIFGISPWGVRLPAALFGILGVLGIYLLSRELFRKDTPALISAAVLAFSPWHIQYSRAAFEVTMLMAFIVWGLYFFYKAIAKSHSELFSESKRNNKKIPDQVSNDKRGSYLVLSAVLLISTPLIYSTAKLFMPFFLLALFVIYRKQILLIDKKYLKYGLITALIVGIPTAYATLYSGGTQRFGYISIFTDPTIETEIGARRDEDLKVGLVNPVIRRVFHNKATYWTEQIGNNFLDSISTQFLFAEGDINLRHSIEGIGMFYQIELMGLLAGIVFLFWKLKYREVKILLTFWIIFGILPAALTRDGGGHATRLIIILPPLVMLISYGLYQLTINLKGYNKVVFVSVYFFFFLLSFIFYQHLYWIHNPYYSERWWHSGFKETVQYVKENESKYDRVIFTNRPEPPWVFFSGWWEYPPEEWQKNKPDKNWSDMEGFGRVTNIDKFYFGSINQNIGIYGVPEYIDDKTLYIASNVEIGANLIREPERTPPGLTLLKSVTYPSGEPAFYIFTKNEN